MSSARIASLLFFLVTLSCQQRGIRRLAGDSGTDSALSLDSVGSRTTPHAPDASSLSEIDFLLSISGSSRYLCGCSPRGVTCAILTIPRNRDRLFHGSLSLGTSCLSVSVSEQMLCWTEIRSFGFCVLLEPGGIPGPRFSFSRADARNLAWSPEDQILLDSRDQICVLSRSRRRVDCARIPDDQGMNHLPLRMRELLPEPVRAMSIYAGLMCVLYESGKIRCSDGFGGQQREQEMRLGIGRRAQAIAALPSVLFSATSNGEISVFGDPRSEGEPRHARFSSRPRERYRGIQGSVTSMALGMEYVYTTSGSAVQWWNYMALDAEDRAHPSGSFNSGAEGLQFVHVSDISDLVCLYNRSGLVFCGDGSEGFREYRLLADNFTR